ncbi:FeoA family protein [Treponema sp. Marseille-Q3903]|jgi:fe2+ transport system protein A|uniref:FeoA family protein n=1 Tax=Treponema sp. Marseille-Q3903 TaxID=2766703 RepID=UPI001651B289|nr:FeoA family protein [Treponema sp. Marseille-Q3903]MBC6713176.1 ferrous iron transport protein A [Treponema sp. Marseille-Q3903]
MTNLTELKDGKKASIVKIDGGRRYLSRITSIGLNTGTSLEMLHNNKKQPLLIFSRDTMIALNRDEAKQIFVEEK